MSGVVGVAVGPRSWKKAMVSLASEKARLGIGSTVRNFLLF